MRNYSAMIIINIIIMNMIIINTIIMFVIIFSLKTCMGDRKTVILFID